MKRIVHMNRIKKEELKKEQARLQGLSGYALKHERECIEQGKRDEREAYRKCAEEFPEEFDWMYDTASESKDRKRGISPMNREYQDKVNKRRADQGLEPYFSQDELNPPTSQPEQIEPNENDTRFHPPEGFNDLEVAMHRLIGGHLRLNNTSFKEELIRHFQQDHPEKCINEIEAAYTKAWDLWVDAYCD